MSLYQKAVEKWGVEAQRDMIIEECAELIDALVKLKRNRVGIRDVIGECVDVEIMLKQAEHMFGPAFWWDEIRTEKMRRFKKYLEGDKHG